MNDLPKAPYGKVGQPGADQAAGHAQFLAIVGALLAVPVPCGHSEESASSGRGFARRVQADRLWRKRG
jgi:hypothetical protein